MVAGGKLFATVFGLDYTIAVLAGATSVVSYTLFGGFLAVSWTDVVQGLPMAAAEPTKSIRQQFDTMLRT